MDPTFNSDVTVSGVSTSDGTATVAAVHGVASLSGLTLDMAGTQLLFLGAGDGSLSPTTAPIAVTATSATRLVVISPPPAAVTAGSKFGLVLAAGNLMATWIPTSSGT